MDEGTGCGIVDADDAGRDLPVVLSWLSAEAEADGRQVRTDLGAVRQTAEGIDGLDQRLERLLDEVPGVAVRRSPSSPAECGPRRTEGAAAGQDWSELADRARRRLAERGIAPDTCSVDELLDPREVEIIERRFAGAFSVSTRLDSYDVGGLVAAGLVAALVDFFVVRIPRDIVYLGQFDQAGSPLTGWIRSLEVPTDNWLAGHFKTAYDHVTSVQPHIDGFGPKTHRLQTFGHDPLVGLVVGTIDIMRGGLTAVSRDGRILAFSDLAPPVYNPLKALVWQVMHLLSDGFTHMGIPAPGWSLLQTFQVGDFGMKDRTVADLARFMYLKGYDTRHFLTMATSVAAAEVVLRGYFSIRQKLDPEYEKTTAREADVCGSERLSDHPRYQVMALGAHGLAAGINAGKVALYAGNPLAINYAQWLRFADALFRWMKVSLRSPTDVLQGHARANWRELEAGWPEIDAECEDFPRMVLGAPSTGAE